MTTIATQVPRAGRLRSRVAGAVREQSLFLVGVGVIGLHVADDNFLQPEPGTWVGDHLVSGLVPLAVLGLAAMAYPRLRAGPRAALALALGLFGLITASEAVFYAREVGPSGDDYSGLLAVLGGVLLLGTGATTLWRERRMDERRTRRYLRRLLVGAGSAILAVVIFFPLALGYGVTHIARAEVPAPDLGASHEEVSFTTSDGLELSGWYIPSRNGAAVIAFPGRSGPQAQARMLARHGYGVLLFDRRGEGASEGDPNAFGWAGDRDLKAALSFLADRPDVDPDRIGGIGLSVGGELLLETAAEGPGLAAVVSEGAGGRSVREELERSNADWWISRPLQSLITASTAVFSNHTPPPSLRDLVGQIAPRPVFLIYGANGQLEEEKDLNGVYYAAAGEPKSLWGSL